MFYYTHTRQLSVCNMLYLCGKPSCRQGLPTSRTHGCDCSVLRISVPVHGDSALKTGLQKQIMKMAGIEESEL